MKLSKSMQFRKKKPLKYALISIQLRANFETHENWRFVDGKFREVLQNLNILEIAYWKACNFFSFLSDYLG